MTELMTRQEMLIRLKAGQSPYDLVVERWNRNAHWLLGRSVLPDSSIPAHAIDTSSCAFCELYYAKDGCSECPYFLHFGYRCDSQDGHWSMFAFNPNFDSAIAMRDALIEVKQAFQGHPRRVIVTKEGMMLSDLVFELVTEYLESVDPEEAVGEYIQSRTGLLTLLEVAERAGERERIERKYGIVYEEAM